jgi:hypothetical protein
MAKLIITIANTRINASFLSEAFGGDFSFVIAYLINAGF